MVPKQGFHVERNVCFRGVLAHSDFCRTEVDVGLKKMCGSDGRKQKGIIQQWDVSHRHRVQCLVRKPGFEVEKCVFFGEVLEKSD